MRLIRAVTNAVWRCVAQNAAIMMVPDYGRRNVRVLTTVLLSASLCSLLDARQDDVQKAPEALAFEVASVRQNTSGSDRASFQFLPGRFIAINTPLRTLITLAYDVPSVVQRHLLAGGPDTVLSRRFDVTATMGDSVSQAHARLMLRALLSERFNLRIHVETRQIPVYALTVARDGHLGTNLRRSSHNCSRYGAAVESGARVVQPTDSDGQPLCRGTIEFLTDGIRLRSAGDLASLVEQAQGLMDRLIVNRTGLQGDFEWTVTYAPAPLRQSSLSSIFTAFTEQLGLKFQPGTASAEVRVIDSVSMPDPN